MVINPYLYHFTKLLSILFKLYALIKLSTKHNVIEISSDHVPLGWLLVPSYVMSVVEFSNHSLS